MAFHRTLDILDKYMFASVEEMDAAHINKATQGRVLRLRDIYTYWLQFPRLSEREINKEIRHRYGVTNQQASLDIRDIKVCLGRFNQVTKDYDMYRFRQLLDEGLDMARRDGDVSSFAKLLASYGKMARLDKEEADAPAYGDIVPQQFTLSTDPSVLGITPVKNWREKVAKMQKQWAKEAKVVEVEEITDE